MATKPRTRSPYWKRRYLLEDGRVLEIKTWSTIDGTESVSFLVKPTASQRGDSGRGKQIPEGD